MRYECMSICSWNILKNEGETHCNNPQQRLWQVLLSFLFYIYVESHLRLSSVSFQFHAHLWILNISLLKRSKGKVYFLSVKRKNGDRWAWMRLKFTRGPWMHHSTQNKEAERSGHGEEYSGQRRGINLSSFRIRWLNVRDRSSGPCGDGTDGKQRWVLVFLHLLMRRVQIESKMWRR